MVFFKILPVKMILSARAIVLLCLFCACFLPIFVTSAHFWYQYGHTQPFTVSGQLLSVDKCKEKCFNAPIGASGCVQAIQVTLQWTFENTTYTESEINADVAKCGSYCCQDSVGKPILVEIDPDVPADALTFWHEKAEPFQSGSLFGAVALTVLSVLVLALVCGIVAIEDGETGDENRLINNEEQYL